MLKNKKSLLNKFTIAKNEFVSMKLHFRYHTYLSIKDGDIYEECRYCKDRLENDKNRKIASNENENEKGDMHPV
jgi:biotin synthase-like enzyme